MSQATARAHSNIALIKYWGKRAGPRNLPAVGSISVTLDGLYTDTTVVFDEALAADTAELDKKPVDTARLTPFLDLVRARAGIDTRAAIVSANNFPTGAGLASSASGFAALSLAATRAAGLALSPRELSILARQGSGSAARSVFGGFAEMHRGELDDGSDAFAESMLDPGEWPLEIVVAITDRATKSVNSSIGMSHLDQRSDYYSAWVAHSETDLSAMRDAIAARDFETVGALTEMSCLKLHGLMMSTRPGLIYWNPATVAAMQAVRALREAGTPVYFTIDAGPQVKALCAPGHGEAVARALARVPGVLETRRTALGPAASVLA
ncbi:diphosphomevalonate decarboxylase [Salinisphaera sp. LB1]|uniref:diphosphomevalonate decarboxylase n=1 Tax=Salinisphaera sp. LB1 TaxID=2183911 RepID=UPI000D7E457F|nr:diphosphomevalonate decarboxylase [Salinisphaera sp. LB1]AWN16360.1 Diphosphomevalonate decarboxylase [Salinisphaera sp. LB1]